MNDILLSILLAKAKTVLRITTDIFDEEIKDIIKAGYYDLNTRGVTIAEDENSGEISPLYRLG